MVVSDRTIKQRVHSKLMKQIITHQKFMENFDKNTGKTQMLITRRSRIDEVYQNFHKNYAESMEILEDNDELITSIEKDMEDFEQRYFDIVSQIDELTVNQETAEDSKIKVNAADIKHVNSSINMPKVQLPTFDGNVTNWIRFKDSFNAMVKENTNLSDIQKLFYLDGCIVGDARNITEKVEFSADGFDVAWTALMLRYDNKRIIIENHIVELLKLNSLYKEASSEIHKIIDNVSVHLSALRKLGQNVDSWNMIIIQLVAQKLDNETRKLWEAEIGKEILPTWEQMFNFLQDRCRILKTVEDNQPSTSKQLINLVQSKPQSNTQLKKSNKNFVLASTNSNYSKNVSKPCIICKANHLIYSCEPFLKLSVLERYNKAKLYNLCLNCLKQNHKIQNCLASLCRHCGLKHHSLLHRNNSQKFVEQDKCQNKILPVQESIPLKSSMPSNNEQNS